MSALVLKQVNDTVKLESDLIASTLNGCCKSVGVFLKTNARHDPLGIS